MEKTIEQQIIKLITNNPQSFNDLLQSLNSENSRLRPAQLDQILRKMITDQVIFFRYKNRTYNLKDEETTIGIFKETRKGFGFVENEVTTIFIPERFVLNALEGDTVKVKLLPRREGESDSLKQAGKIVRVMQRNGNNIIGTVQKNDQETIFLPDEVISKHDYVLESKLPLIDGDVVVTKFYDFKDQKIYLEVKEVLGKRDNLKIDYLVVAKKNNLAITFPEAVLKESEQLEVDMKTELLRRVDLRTKMIVTIDGDDSKDLDDAIQIDKLADGTFKLNVHIADVTHFLDPDSKLDEEAYKRGTSVYLINKVLPMLPENLSNNLCSLNPDTEKLCLSCEMVIDKNGQVIKKHLYKSVIISKYRLTYNEVDEFLKSDQKLFKNDQGLTDLLQFSKELSTILRKNKISKGMIDFALPEAKVILNDDDEVVDIIAKNQTESEQIIEDLMVITNQSVAEIFTEKQFPNIFRVHGKPKLENLLELIDFLKIFGKTIAVNDLENTSSKEISHFINNLDNSKESALIKKRSIQSMEKAVYSSTDAGHYALGLKNYLHFTSPIRRYPDVIVHRLTKELVLTKRNTNLNDLAGIKDYLDIAGPYLSEREHLAMVAERKLVDIKKARLAATFEQKIFKGVIVTIIASGIFIEIDYMIQGFVRIDSTDSELFYERESKSVINKTTKDRYYLGQNVDVKITSVDVVRGLINLSFNVN